MGVLAVFVVLFLVALLIVVPSVVLHKRSSREKTSSVGGKENQRGGGGGGGPRKIYMLWFQGWDSAPELYKLAADHNEALNPTWDLVRVDREMLSDLAPGLKRRPGQTMQSFSDQVRLAILRRHGGVWLDASVFLTQPLDEWLPQTDFAVPVYDDYDWSEKLPSGIQKGKGISSWFVFAREPGNEVVRRWEERFAANLDKKDMKDFFFLVHLSFMQLMQEDEQFRLAAQPDDGAQFPNSDKAHALQWKRPTTAKAAKEMVRESPIHKLTAKSKAFTDKKWIRDVLKPAIVGDEKVGQELKSDPVNH